MLGSIRHRQPFLQTLTLPFPPLNGAVFHLVPSLRRTIDAAACLFQTGAEVRFRSTGGSEGVSVVGGGGGFRDTEGGGGYYRGEVGEEGRVVGVSEVLVEGGSEGGSGGGGSKIAHVG